jgi:hypothetical protein
MAIRPEQSVPSSPEIYIPGGRDQPQPSAQVQFDWSDQQERRKDLVQYDQLTRSGQLAILPLLRQQQRPSDHEPSSDKIREVNSKVQPGVVEIYSGFDSDQVRGSGSVISPEGYVLTCAHVVQYAPEGLTVRTSDRHDYPAHVVKIDPEHDLALLKAELPPGSVHPISIGSGMPKPGEQVFDFGSPRQSNEANPNGYHFAVSPGFFDHLASGRDLLGGYKLHESFSFLTKNELKELDDFSAVRAEAVRVNSDHGGSGGPLVDSKAELIGVHFAGGVDSSGKPKRDFKYFRPLDEVKSFLSSTDPKLEPKVQWRSAGLIPTAFDQFRAKPMEKSLFMAQSVAPAVLLMRVLPYATKHIPALSSVSQWSESLAVGAGRALGVTGGVTASFYDSYGLFHSNSLGEAAYHSAALLSDAGITRGSGLFGKYRPLTLAIGLAGRIASEFIPYHQTYY